MLMRPKQAAKENGLGYGYVLSLMKSGALTPVYLPDRTFPLVDSADLERLISEAKSGSDGGSKLPSEAEKLQSSPAPKKQSRRRKTDGTFDDKPKWVKEFSRVH